MTTHLPIRTVSEANTREHWRIKAQRVKQQRRDTFYALLSTWGRRPIALPCTITLTRESTRQLDTDNLVSSLKAVQDGVADWLCGTYGEGQDRQDGLTWRYTQRQTKLPAGVTITVGEDHENP